jgi:hypothetical protein
MGCILGWAHTGKINGAKSLQPGRDHTYHANRVFGATIRGQKVPPGPSGCFASAAHMGERGKRAHSVAISKPTEGLAMNPSIKVGAAYFARPTQNLGDRRLEKWVWRHIDCDATHLWSVRVRDRVASGLWPPIPRPSALRSRSLCSAIAKSPT